MCRDKLTYQQCRRAAVAYCEVAQDGHAVTLHSHLSSSTVAVSIRSSSSCSTFLQHEQRCRHTGGRGCNIKQTSTVPLLIPICFNLEHPVSLMSSYVAPACGAYGSCQQLSMASLTSSTYVSCSAPALGALQSKLTRTPPAGSSSATARC